MTNNDKKAKIIKAILSNDKLIREAADYIRFNAKEVDKSKSLVEWLSVHTAQELKDLLIKLSIRGVKYERQMPFF